MNDHRLEDGGFVGRLKPTKGKRILSIIIGSWPSAISPSLSSPEGEGFQPSPMGTLKPLRVSETFWGFFFYYR
jgi:hypothetical protein